MIKLVIADIDNTIVPKHKQPSPETVVCIKELQKRGIYFGLASGRRIDIIHDLEKQWDIKCDVLIGTNGGELYDNVDGSYEKAPNLKKEELKQIYEIMEPFMDKVNISIYTGGVRYVSRLDEQTKNSIQYQGNKKAYVVIDRPEQIWQVEVPKVGFRTPEELMPEVEKRVAMFNDVSFQSFKTEFTMYEFMPKTCNKGKMMMKFAEKHNIKKEETLVFGDMTNDLQLFEEAGTAVCMLNGSDDAKAASHIISEKSIEDDGWVYFVKDHLLTNNPYVLDMERKTPSK